MKNKDIKSVEKETKRFLKRLKSMKKRAKEDSFAFHGCKESGALKRSALDLKMELTKITK